MTRSLKSRIKLAIVGVAGIGLVWFLAELDGQRPGSLEWERLHGLDELSRDLDASDVALEEPPPAPPPEPVTVPCAITGTVTCDDIPRPLAGARVRLIWRGTDDELASQETITADDGAFAFEVPLALAAAGADGQVDVVLEVLAEGRADYLRELSPNVLTTRCQTTFDVWLEGGRAVTGLVRSADGDPVDGAEVHLYRTFVDRSGDTSWIEVDAVRTVLDGRFAVVVRRPGNYSLRARAEGLGAALDDLGAVRADSDLDVGELRLSGGNSLAGRVTDPNGGALDGVLVRAIHVTQSERPRWDAQTIDRARLAESSVGQLYGQAAVAEDGSFEVAGLAPGDFWVSVLPGGNVGRLDPGPYPSGRRDIVLVVPVYRIQVSVHARPGGARPRGRAFCTEVLRDGDRWRPVGELQTEHLYEGPIASFRVEPGRTYAAGVLSSSLPPLERIVRIEEGRHRTPIELFPARARAFGTVVTNLGGPEPEPGTKARFEVLSPESRVVLRSDVVTLGRGGHAVELAPGTYLIRAKVLTWPLDRDFSLPVEESVEVQSRETTTLEIPAVQGGRVRLSTYPAGTIVDEELAQLVQDVRLRGVRPSGETRARHGSRVRVGQPGDERPIVTDLVFQDGYTSSPPRVLFPGESVLLTEVLPPGRHVLSFEFPGFEPLSHAVDVVPGQVTDARVGLVPLR